eukprot:357700-Chlamydomonas_euryale.AAC.2
MVPSPPVTDGQSRVTAAPWSDVPEPSTGLQSSTHRLPASSVPQRTVYCAPVAGSSASSAPSGTCIVVPEGRCTSTGLEPLRRASSISAALAMFKNTSSRDVSDSCTSVMCSSSCGTKVARCVLRTHVCTVCMCVRGCMVCMCVRVCMVCMCVRGWSVDARVWGIGKAQQAEGQAAGGAYAPSQPHEHDSFRQVP